MGNIQLKGAIETNYCYPRFFSDKLQVSSTCELDSQIVKAFNGVLLMLVDPMKEEGMNSPDFQALVYFIDADDFSIQLIEESTQGLYFPVVVYPVNRWRKINLSEHSIMVAMLEELVHCFFRIRDESLVKQKMLEVVQRYYPMMTRQALFRDFHDPGAPTLSSEALLSPQ